jgi:flagellar biosynthesis/type III secretory pathway chaperone
MESGATLAQTAPHPGALSGVESPLVRECLDSAIELLEILRAEAEILKRFAGSELLALVPKKEFLVSELEWKLKSAGEAGVNSFADSDSLGGILDEIARLNASNGIFIEKSLSYWQGLMSIFVPTGYGPTGEVTRRLPVSPKGAAFRRKV